jgi:hypothetical protein
MNVTNALGLNVDNVIYFVVKNTINAMLEKQGTPAGDGWTLGHVNQSVLEEIKDCISHMTDGHKATAASFWVLQHLPPGSDKVLASRGAEATARAWFEQEGQDAAVGLEQLRRTRKQLETEQVLHRHGLASPRYLELAQQSEPIQLINSLFEDPSIEARHRVAAGEHPDIVAAAVAIAGVNELSLVKMKYDLLDRWLPLASATSAGSADDTMADFTLNLGTAVMEQEQEATTDEANLLRCVYLLQTGSEGGLQYLLKYAFSTDPMVTTSHKLRALKCLFSICSEAELEAATGRPVAALRDGLRRLVYLARLEGLGLPYTTDSLQPAAVPQLVEGVWRACRLSPPGVTLVRDLCAEYGVWTQQLWAALLQQMIKFSMLPELRATLRLLNRQPELWSLGPFLPAWDLVLQAPLLTLLPPLAPEVAARAAAELDIIQFCPTAGDLDLSKLVHLLSLLLPCSLVYTALCPGGRVPEGGPGQAGHRPAALPPGRCGGCGGRGVGAGPWPAGGGGGEAGGQAQGTDGAWGGGHS